MLGHNFLTKFELKPGRTVFVPTKAARVRGKVICKKVLRRWQPCRIFYHLHHSGGHIAALRLHVGNAVFARLDLEHYYASVTRTKVARSLRRLRFAHREAFDMAADSVIVADGRKRLPHGFIQSMLLATLALEHSQLGRVLTAALPVGIRVSVYVDDVLISGPSEAEVATFIAEVEAAAAASGFSFGAEKRIGPTNLVEAFNIELHQNGMNITECRMDQFRELVAGANESVIEGVRNYVRAVNPVQLEDL